MVSLHLTRHLVDGLRERGLERGWVERIARDPDWIEPSPSRTGVQLRYGRIDEAGGKILRVTTIDEAGVRVVITAHFDRKATQRARRTDAPHL
jgi:Domain of unknown function (DUF4258)